MITITTPEQLAEALADGLRLEDPTQRGRGLSETEALELIAAGAELIIPGSSDIAEEVPRKHGRSGLLNHIASLIGSPDATRPGDPIDFKTTFESPRYVHYTTPHHQAEPHRVERGSWLEAWNGSAAPPRRAVEQNHRAIRLALIPPSRS